MATYADLLKHPNWQRKRLEILNRDDFTCKCCGAKESTLHVHHFKYQKGNMPWEYPNENLITMCESCHYDEEQFIKGHNESFVKLSRMYDVPVRKMWHLSFLLCYAIKSDPDRWQGIKNQINSVVDDNFDGFERDWEKYHA